MASSIQNEYELHVDIKSNQVDVMPRFYQYDYASLTIFVFDGGKPYDLRQFDRVRIYHKRLDGEIITADAELVLDAIPEKSYIKYVYTGEEMDVVGSVGTSLAMFYRDYRVSIQPFEVRILSQEK